MKTIIAGSRSIVDYAVVKQAMAWALKKKGITPSLVISGCATGVDTLGEKWAFENSLLVKKFPADWATYGKRAGALRNEKMAAEADALVALWSGTSRGTQHMIHFAKSVGLKVFVCYVSEMEN